MTLQMRAHLQKMIPSAAPDLHGGAAGEEAAEEEEEEGVVLESILLCQSKYCNRFDPKTTGATVNKLLGDCCRHCVRMSGFVRDFNAR